MLSSAVTTKGQVTVPAELREKLGIKPGDRVGFVEENGRLIIQPHPQGWRPLSASLRPKNPSACQLWIKPSRTSGKTVLALDTNVLVRILIDDTQFIDQCAAARAGKRRWRGLCATGGTDRNCLGTGERLRFCAGGACGCAGNPAGQPKFCVATCQCFARRVRRIPQRRGVFFRLCDPDASARPKYDFGDL